MLKKLKILLLIQKIFFNEVPFNVENILPFYKNFFEQNTYVRFILPEPDCPIFIEQIIEPQIYDSLKKITKNGKNNFRQFNTPLLVQMPIYQYFRTRDLFNGFQRGRNVHDIDIILPQQQCNFGIADDQHMEEWCKNYFTQPQTAAKDRFQCNENSPLVTYFRNNSLPFISGPSGTLTYIFCGLYLLKIEFTIEELIELVALQTASMISRGHHSVVEMMLIAGRMKLYKTSTGEFLFYPHPQNTFESNLALYQSSLTQLYDLFIPNSVKQTQQFLDLQHQYPDFLSTTTINTNLM